MTSNVRKITVTAMLSAIAFILMFFEFPIPIMPSFIKMDISDLPALLGAFAYGPISGAMIELLKNLLHIILKGTTTGGVGELSNFILGCFMVIPAGMIYQKKKTRTRAIAGALIGCLVMAVLSLPSNYFVVYPVYTKFMPIEAIIGMYQAIMPSVDGLFACLLIFNVPFTFCKGLLDAVICFLVYKPLSPILHG